ncbi:MAG TPA: Gfo/Idh/MocA family oxidoreductase [Planctomycetaceae bacterium]|jgi:predicted dehydrogenase|nr:Gfo/Idh/MocA family oxidoreductase [Planctomycetaceae bacterium]
MAEQRVRIGIVGAGKNTRERHVPGFRSLSDVEISGVANSTAESTARAAKELGIAKSYPSWRELVADPQIDAVCIGTWPNLHCEITCAALAAGKHVLTEARMARNAEEAHRMLQAAHQYPDLVKQIVPSPLGLVQNDHVREMIADGFLGEILEVAVIGANDVFANPEAPLHWRQETQKSGFNVLSLGILHETVLRWAPAPVSVFAEAQTFVRSRPTGDGSGRRAEVTVPDSVQVLTDLENGGRGLYHISGVCRFGPGNQIHLYGSEGTLRYETTPVERLLTGRAGEKQLLEFEVPAEKRGGWRVEAEFIGAIRGYEKVRLTDFATGVKYMEFTEAVARSAASQTRVPLPLPEYTHLAHH